jgi:hypothetical protein
MLIWAWLICYWKNTSRMVSSTITVIQPATNMNLYLRRLDDIMPRNINSGSIGPTIIGTPSLKNTNDGAAHITPKASNSNIVVMRYSELEDLQKCKPAQCNATQY